MLAWGLKLNSCLKTNDWDFGLGLNNYLKACCVLNVFGFCRRLPSRWRPLEHEGLKNYLKTLLFS